MVYLPKFAADEVPSEEEIRQMLEQARLTREKREDESYEARQKGKVVRELKGPREKRDHMTDPAAQKGHTSEQEREIQEYMAKQEKSEGDAPAPGEGEGELEGIMSDPELVQQDPPGGWRCMNEGHQDRPASLKIKHSGVLGEDVGDLYFCEDCAYKFKFIPMGDKEEKIKRWVKGKNKMYVIKKLSDLADRCDGKELYGEASVLDSLIYKTNGEKR